MMEPPPDTTEEADEEPKLKYMRLGASVFDILQKDAATCMAVHEKFLALGTHWGVVYILDVTGNEIKRFAAHSACVNELCIEETGEYIGSCSDDGRVVIRPLFSNGEVVEQNYHRAVLSLAIDPDFQRKKTRSVRLGRERVVHRLTHSQFAAGTAAGQLILNEKGYLFGQRDTILHSNEGPVLGVRWRGSLVAWANDTGVRIHDVVASRRLAAIDRPKGSPRPNQYKASLFWERDNTLVIGWADMVKIAVVRSKELASGESTRVVDVVAFFQLDYYISGVASFGEYLVVLAYVTEEINGALVPQRPELRIISRKNEELSSDALSVSGFEKCKATDYQLYQMPHEPLFFVVTAKDIVTARPCDLDDHITWLLEQKKYDAALQAAEANEAQMKQHKLVDIGERYLTHLLDSGDVQKAADLCGKFMGRDARLWEKWIFKFAKMQQLRVIAPHIPIRNPQLTETVYEMVLNYFLTNDEQGFYRTITEWPSNIYKLQNIITAVNERTKTASLSSILWDALAELYTYDKAYDKALGIYLQQKRGNVFDLIAKHSLFDSIQDKILTLMNFNQAEAVKLLVANVHRVAIGTVVAQLKEQPAHLHAYLHAVFVKDVHLGADFHELQVHLYAQYDHKALLPFLRQSNYYPLQHAFKICEQRQLYPEMVFILGRMGNTKQALALIIEKIGDVKEAIDFINSHNDKDLWEDLINHAMKSPSFVSGLLEHIGGHVDPIKLIKKIPEGMKIPSLRDRLVKIISDYNLQMSLREGCNTILKADCVDLNGRLYRGLRRGVRLDPALSNCAICSTSLCVSGGVRKSDASAAYMVFFCGHQYHMQCLKTSVQHLTAGGGGPVPPAGRVAGKVLGAALDASGLAAADSLWCVLCQNSATSNSG